MLEVIFWGGGGGGEDEMSEARHHCSQVKEGVQSVREKGF